MTPRPSRLWWLSGLAVAALTLNAQPSPSSTTPSPSAETAPAPLTTTPRLVVVGNPNDPWEGPIDAPTLPLKLLLPIVERLTGRIALPSQGLNNPDLPIVFKATPTRGELLQAIETVLTMNQLALVPLGPKFLKVVPLGNARIEAPALIEGSTLDLPPGGQIAAKLFQLQFLRASEFLPLVGPLLNPNATGGAPVLFDKANAVLVTDSISTLQRIEQIIAKTDAPNAAGIQTKFYTLTNGAKASDIVTQLRNFLQPLQAQMGAGTSYHADDRTNQIIIFSDPRQLPFFDELITKLDVKSDPNTRNEVIPLKHADATEVATLLTTLITGQTRATQANGNRSNVRPVTGDRTANQPPSPNAPPGTNTPVPAGPMIDVGSASNEFSSLVNIQADVRSNAIVVTGTLDDMRLIKQLIEKLDIVLPQVRIEVVIAEVQLSDGNETGINSLGLAVRDGKVVGFAATGAGFAIGGGGDGSSTTPTGFNIPSGKFDLNGIVNFAANSAKTNTRILANPTLTTTHNKKATIFVGESRPGFGQVQTVDSTSGTDNGANALRSSIEYQEAGTRLTITPLIGIDGVVQLEIEQEFNAFGAEISLGSDLQQAPINKRETNSFVSVRNNEIIVLGGYRTQTNEKSRARLGPIPFIGDLLGRRTFRTVNNELIVFIRPRVIHAVDQTTADAETVIRSNENLSAIEEHIKNPSGFQSPPKSPPKRRK